MRPPLVSVCVPTFNGETYLRAALDSVSDQTCTDLEVLIVDDASSDGTVEIARAYAAADPRFRVSENPQRLGLVGNWNRCVELARGEWIKFVFQDDLILPQCIEKLLEVCRRTRLPFGCCRRRFEFDESVSPQLQAFFDNNDREIEEVFLERDCLSPEEFSNVILNNVGRNFVGEPTAVLLHRRVFETYGKFNPAILLLCDAEYWYRVGCHVGVARVHDVLAMFRVHRQSTSSVSHATRQYRLSALDRLVLLHECVCSPVYKQLRDVAQARRGSDHLVAELRQAGLWALQAAKEPVTAGDAAGYSKDHELEEVLAAYPAIRVISAQEAELQQVRQQLEESQRAGAAQARAIAERDQHSARKDDEITRAAEDAARRDEEIGRKDDEVRRKEESIARMGEELTRTSEEIGRQRERLEFLALRLSQIQGHPAYRVYQWVKRTGSRNR